MTDDGKIEMTDGRMTDDGKREMTDGRMTDDSRKKLPVASYKLPVCEE